MGQTRTAKDKEFMQNTSIDMRPNLRSKLPNVGTTIFTIMSALANQYNAINLSQGFPNFDCSEKLKSLVSHYMNKGMNQYAPMAGLPLLRERIAEKTEKIYGKHINPDTEITITAGATQALYTAISAFISQGDEVILIEPAYDSYGPAVELNGGRLVPYELKAPKYEMDWQAFGQLISDKTRMIIINTPHNPSGTTLKAKDLQALEKLTRDTNILVLSDEVYEHLIYDGQEHQSLLRYPKLYERGLITYSFGKTYHNTGWKMGYCIAPAYLMKEFQKVHQFNVFSVNRPVQHAFADMLSFEEEYLGLSHFFQEKRDYLGEVLKNTRLKPIPSEGTYFQLFDYSRISDEKDTDFAKRMTIEFGVASIPISVFYSSGRDDKMIRLCFAKTKELLEKAGKLLKKM